MSRQRGRGALSVITLCWLMLLTGCTGPSAEPEAADGFAPGTASVLAGDLEVPWSLAFLDVHSTGTDGFTALVSERDSARILEIDPEGNVREMGTIGGVVPQGEGGLLGIAVHSGYLYAYFTSAEDNRVERAAISGAAGSLALGDSQPIITGIPSAGNHNGGRIAFGPDGMLYVTTGDAGDRESAQDIGSLSGKILRLTPDGEVPRDNPVPGSPVYTLGHRNPQGIAWDEDGAMYASEFGQSTWDELNVIEAGGNYGWPEVEGIEGGTGFTDPVQQWAPESASPSGITIASGTVYVANLRGERLRAVPIADLGVSNEYFVSDYGRLRDVATAPDGSLWVLTNNTDGRGSPGAGDDRLLRIAPEGMR